MSPTSDTTQTLSPWFGWVSSRPGLSPKVYGSNTVEAAVSWKYNIKRSWRTGFNIRRYEDRTALSS